MNLVYAHVCADVIHGVYRGSGPGRISPLDQCMGELPGAKGEVQHSQSPQDLSWNLSVGIVKSRLLLGRAVADLILVPSMPWRPVKISCFLQWSLRPP